MKGYQSDEAGVESSPLSYGWRAMRHLAEPLKLRERPVSESGDLGIFSLRELDGFSDEVSKAGLPKANPLAVNPITVAHKNPFPVPNEGFEGFLGTVRMNHEKGYRGIGHDPKPLEHFLLAKRGLINVIDLALPCHLADFLIVGLESRGDTINDLLDSAKAYGDSQYRCTELLNRGAAVTLAPSHLGYCGAESWTVSCAVFSGQRRLARFPAAWAGSPVEDEVSHLHLDLGKLDVLMGVIGARVWEILVATAADFGFQMFGFPGLQHHLPVPFVPLLSTGLS
jgi:hypothetical protein